MSPVHTFRHNGKVTHLPHTAATREHTLTWYMTARTSYCWVLGDTDFLCVCVFVWVSVWVCVCVCVSVCVCVCVHVPVIAVHLPLCADMGSFSAATQCSFYSLPLSLSRSLSLFLSPPLSLTHSCSSPLFLSGNTALSLPSVTFFSTSFHIHSLIKGTSFPPPSCSAHSPPTRAPFAVPSVSPPPPLSLSLYTFVILSLFYSLAPAFSPLSPSSLSASLSSSTSLFLSLSFCLSFSLSLSLSCKVGQTWKQC